MSGATNGAETASGGRARFSHLGSTTGSEATDASYVRSNPDFLCLVLDIDPSAWADRDEGLEALLRAVRDLCIFLNAHLALRHDNCCAVYIAGRAKGSLVYSNAPSLSTDNGASTAPDANTYQPFKRINDAVLRGAQEMLADAANELDLPPLQGVVSSLAQALCHINRLGQLASVGTEEDAAVTTASRKAANARGFRNRILILSASPDSSSQYVAVMNCIFGAQKQGITIDVCKLLGGQDSVFLQQACHLTGGVYFRLDGSIGLLQTLMTAFLPSPSLRTQIRLPSNDDVDFRAACFCHGGVVDVGYVCSVCLSIYCEPRDRCMTCRARFPRRTLLRLQEEQKALSSTSATVTS